MLRHARPTCTAHPSHKSQVTSKQASKQRKQAAQASLLGKLDSPQLPPPTRQPGPHPSQSFCGGTWPRLRAPLSGDRPGQVTSAIDNVLGIVAACQLPCRLSANILYTHGEKKKLPPPPAPSAPRSLPAADPPARPCASGTPPAPPAPAC